MIGPTRTEHDSIGAIEVPLEGYWGAGTQRSLENFPIGRATFEWRPPIIRAFGTIKRVAAETNGELGLLDPERAEIIAQVAGEVEAGIHDSMFPLVVFQTGSGTQTNMNANEVIANRAIELLHGVLGSNDPIHPNDHVNLGQSSNDIFPTVMHLATMRTLYTQLHPALFDMCDLLAELAARHANLVKVGRTHLQDATPITLGQEIGAWTAQIVAAHEGLVATERGLLQLAVGGTATGTGLNTHPRFAQLVTDRIAEAEGHDYVVAPNHFAATSAHDAMVATSAALRTLAGALTKMANDVRWLASGPRNGIGELRIPANEPGSSIMPGKVNPTQAEALLQVAARVFGNDATVAFAGTQGNFQLNVYKPVIVHTVLESIELLADAVRSFTDRCLAGLEPDEDRIAEQLDRNLMLVTALAPTIGYDAASAIAKHAEAQGLGLREAALDSGEITAEDYDAIVDPLAMTKPG